jgi:hypothetical protein
MNMAGTCRLSTWGVARYAVPFGRAMRGHHSLRASDADREAVVDRLREAAGEGRLEPDELEQRIEGALRARSYGDLAELLVDLPADRRMRSPRARWRTNPVARYAVFGAGLLVAVIVAVAVVAVVAMLVLADPLALALPTASAQLVFTSGRYSERVRPERSAAGEDGRLLQADGMDERIGAAMHEEPVGAVAAIDLGHPQRPVLVGQTADLTVLPLDHYEHDRVVPDVVSADSSFASPALK